MNTNQRPFSCCRLKPSFWFFQVPVVFISSIWNFFKKIAYKLIILLKGSIESRRRRKMCTTINVGSQIILIRDAFLEWVFINWSVSLGPGSARRFFCFALSPLPSLVPGYCSRFLLDARGQLFCRRTFVRHDKRLCSWRIKFSVS